MGMMAGGGALFVNRPEFGRLPQGARLARMEASPHYVDGQFRNLVPVQVMNEKSGENRFVAMAKFLFGDKSELSPQESLLSHKTDLCELDPSRDAAVWMGHSTFFLQLGGRRILIDPVFSSYASPLFFINKAFPGSNVYTAEDMPEIDVLAICLRLGRGVILPCMILKRILILANRFRSLTFAAQGFWLLFVSRGKGLWGTGREVGNRHVDGGMTGERGYVAEKLCI